RLQGEGARLLLEAGRASQFFLVGEEHGVAQVPRLTSALYRALAPDGYGYLAVETGDALAAGLARAAREPEPAKALERFVNEHWPGAPFYTLREEAALIADVAGAGGTVWGLDYDILADRYLLRRLEETAPTPGARAAAAAVRARADSMLSAALAAQNPSALFMFASADTALAALRRAYAPAPGSEAERALALMDETLRINQLWVAGRGYESNAARAAWLKAQFVRHYREAASAGASPPRVILKFGANHLMRGRNLTSTYDLGSLLPELAAFNGTASFGVMVVGDRRGQHAEFDPRTFGYRAGAAEFAQNEWIAPLFAEADPAAWTVYDFRALRPLLYAGRLGTVPPRLTQLIFGFDAFVVLTGSGPSTSMLGPPPSR
ncbi:MAG TPA: hypothetical protein VHG91_07335, partial [Longimicrobium sp.]|nr:hypothetical protein [Longimicrobium sp.]